MIHDLENRYVREAERTFRGIVFGLCLTIPFWVLVGVVIGMVAR